LQPGTGQSVSNLQQGDDDDANQAGVPRILKTTSRIQRREDGNNNNVRWRKTCLSAYFSWAFEEWLLHSQDQDNAKIKCDTSAKRTSRVINNQA
jgi:hypothetical protein